MKKVALFVAAFATAMNVAAQGSGNSEIAKFAKEICDEIRPEGTITRQEIEGRLQGEVGGVARAIGLSVGADGKLRHDKTEYKGLPIEKVSDQMKDARDCRLQVTKMLVEERNRLAPAGPKKTGAVPTAIDLQASRFVRGERVAMATGIVARYGANVLMNAPPYESGPNAAEFEVRPTAPGSYQFAVRYASADSRPVAVSLNGKTVNANALAAPTGCFDPNCQMWMEQGEVSMNEGMNVVRLHTNGVFPHITALRFVPTQQ